MSKLRLTSQQRAEAIQTVVDEIIEDAFDLGRYWTIVEDAVGEYVRGWSDEKLQEFVENLK